MGYLVRRLAFGWSVVGCIGDVMHEIRLGLLRVRGVLIRGRGGLVRRRRLRAIRCGSRWVVCIASMVRWCWRCVRGTLCGVSCIGVCCVRMRWTDCASLVSPQLAWCYWRVLLNACTPGTHKGRGLEE